MPELPEVETTRRSIAPLLLGRTVSAVATTAPSYFFLTPPDELARALAGRRFDALVRHGKYLIATLDDGSRLFLHLGMTGQLFTASAQSVRLLTGTGRGALAPEAQPSFKPDAHTHLVIDFRDGGERVLFRDVRKFGKICWLPRGADDARLDKLGIDALNITSELLFAASRGRRVAVKSFLLDQSVLAGVGNIYADEALFRAQIRPKRAAQSITRKESARLAEAVVAVLQRSIETGGSSMSDYVQPDGKDGAYQLERRVYARANQPCYVCATPITRIVLGARSTHYCKICQR